MTFNPDSESPSAIREYHDKSTLNEQYRITLEYLQDREEFDSFEVWREKNGQKEYLPDIKAFCEEQPEFWQWLIDCRTESRF